jgi:site-specific DNA recombinase
MAKVRSAAIYARISSDVDGTALGVTRQLKDCRTLAAELGWPVGDEYVDNDISAFSGKKRPAYERMLDDLRDGVRDAVVVYHADRLTRRPIELENFLQVTAAANVRGVRFVAGAPVDVADGDGLLVLRLLSAVAANESASKSRRIRRKHDEIAASGMPNGGGQRPYGYAEDKVTVDPVEAKVIKTVVARFIAGESLRSLATWLNTQDIPTVFGKKWQTHTLQGILTSPRIAGLRIHRGEVAGKAAWKPIISERDRARVLARIEQRAVSGRRTPRRYLLSGLLRCGNCDNKLYSASRVDTRRYVCLAGPDHGGCGRLTVVAAPVEELIAKAVLFRLDSPNVIAALAGHADPDDETAALSEKLSEDRAQLDDLARLYADKTLPQREWLAARNVIDARVRETETRLGRLTRTDALVGLGNAKQLGRTWEQLPLTRQHAVVAALLDHCVIAARGNSGSRAFDPDRVQPVWRV